MPKKLTHEEFITKAIAIHSNKYDYFKSVYTTTHNKICIICKEHGKFWQTPSRHLRGQGCRKCWNAPFSNMRRTPIENIVTEFRDVHGDKYGYDMATYKNKSSKMMMNCGIHGNFVQSPEKHIIGQGCPKCIGRHKTTEQIIKEFLNVHGNVYDYSRVEYINSYTPVTIICKDHGEFRQIPTSHLQNHGCLKCRISHGEKIVKSFLVNHHIEFVEQKQFAECLYKRLLSFDFYIPSVNICVEYDGELHYMPMQIPNQKKANDNLKITQLRDKIKTDYCKEKGIRLLRIPYWEKDNIETMLKTELLR